MDDDALDEQTGRAIGERLRMIRRQRQVSLHEVERATNEEFKASVLGAYERGERAISVARLLRLAEFYGVPADQLLPGTRVGVDLTEAGVLGDGGFTVDLRRLAELDGQEASGLGRFVTAIQRKRQDFNGRMLTLRTSDLEILAAALGHVPETFAQELVDLGLRAQRMALPA